MAAYSSKEVAEAKAALCAAYEMGEPAMLRGLTLLVHHRGPQDFAYEVNLRLALYVFATHLMATADLMPAAPENLADAFRELASARHAMNLMIIAGVPGPDFEAASDRLDDAHDAVTQACQ